MAGSNERRNKAVMDKFIKELKEVPVDFDEIAKRVLNGTMEVAEVYAKDDTPSVTGDAKAKWRTTKAYKVANGFKARLYNNSVYIGYVNNGHRMNPHFVPGYWVENEFKYDPKAKEGVVMGSKTPYVKGKFMMEKAVGRAEKHMVKLAKQELEEWEI